MRTNKIYNVTCAIYATLAVEADSPHEAMKLAKKMKDDYLRDEDFEDSEIEVAGCDAYSSGIEWHEDDKYIITADGAYPPSEYAEMLDEHEENTEEE